MAATLPIGGLFASGQREFDYKGWDIKMGERPEIYCVQLVATKKIAGKNYHNSILVDADSNIDDIKKQWMPTLQIAEKRLLRKLS